MKVLVINNSEIIYSQLEEFSNYLNAETIFADNIEDSIGILANFSIDVVLIKLNTILDFGMLKYINDNYANIKVILSANNSLNETISIIQKGNFSMWQEPLRLNDLKIQMAV